MQLKSLLSLLVIIAGLTSAVSTQTAEKKPSAKLTLTRYAAYTSGAVLSAAWLTALALFVKETGVGQKNSIDGWPAVVLSSGFVLGIIGSLGFGLWAINAEADTENATVTSDTRKNAAKIITGIGIGTAYLIYWPS